MRKTLTTTAIAVSAFLAFGSGSAGAAVITPDVLVDELDSLNSDCSLREAVSIANLDDENPEPDCAIEGTLGDDTINLGEGTYLLARVSETGASDNTNVVGDLDVNPAGVSGDLTIAGAGASATRIDTDDDPVWSDRVIDQIAGTSPLLLNDLTVAGGKVPGEVGGGIKVATGSLELQGVRVTDNLSDSGGGIHANANAISLTITDSTIDGNRSDGAVGGAGVFTAAPADVDSSAISGNVSTADGGSGGGLLSTGDNGDLAMTDSLVAGNTAESTTNSSAVGGGILIGNGEATIRGTTIAGNQVLGGLTRLGAGISLGFNGDALTMINSTISGNRAELALGSGAGLRAASQTGVATLIHTTIGPNLSGAAGSAITRTVGGQVRLRGSVVDSPSGVAACSGTDIVSDGHNVLTDLSCGTTSTGDEADADPMLGALADNGGPDAGAPGLAQAIEAHLPLASSTVVDHVPADACLDELAAPLTVDQRGLSRPVDDDGDASASCEAGAVEGAAPPPQTPQTPVTVPPPVIGEDPACASLRERLKRAKRALKKAEREDEPTKKKRRKVRRLRRELDALGC